MIDITPILEGLIAVLVTAISTQFIPYLRSKIRIMNQQADEMDQAMREYWINLAVEAIEQIAIQTHLKGKDKKQYVIDWLNEHNIQVDESKLDAQIEAAVYKLKNKKGVVS